MWKYRCCFIVLSFRPHSKSVRELPPVYKNNWGRNGLCRVRGSAKNTIKQKGSFIDTTLLFAFNVVLLFKICQIGMKRTYLPAEEAVVDKKRKEFLQAHCHQTPSSGSCDAGDERWAEKFSPRSSVEPVKNCTLVKKDIQEEIVQKLTSILLQTQNFVDSEKGRAWNAGGDY